jgi:hypothetical protein
VQVQAWMHVLVHVQHCRSFNNRSQNHCGLRNRRSDRAVASPEEIRSVLCQ